MEPPKNLLGLDNILNELEKSLSSMLSAIHCEIPHFVRLFGFSSSSDCFICPFEDVRRDDFKSITRVAQEENERRLNELKADPNSSENLLRYPNDVMIESVQIAFEQSKLGRRRRAFVSSPQKIGDHFLCAVVLVDKAQHDKHLVLAEKVGFERRGVPPSLPTAIIEALIEVVDEWLKVPNHVEFFHSVAFDPLEIARRAGTMFLRVGSAAGGIISYVKLSRAGNFKLYEALNTVAATAYERKEGRGGFVIANKDRSALDIQVSLSVPIKVTEHRAVRKLLEVCGKQRHLLSDALDVFGIGDIRDDYEENRNDTFLVQFTGRGKWELLHAGNGLMRVIDGQPQLPVMPIDEDILMKTLVREVGATKETKRVVEKVRAVAEAHHGAMIVISSKARQETERLTNDGTPIDPIRADADLLIALSKVDGAVMLDPAGMCYGFGLILDGAATSGGSSSRGARYNSANRYQQFSGKCGNSVVIAISEDGTVDVFPKKTQKTVEYEYV